MVERGGYFGGATGYRIFTAVKYLVYALLSFNVYLFLQEELLALDHTFVGGIEPGQIIQAFAASIDTAAWVILLLLFELETAVLDDSKITGMVKWSLHGIRGLCYIAISYAFTGYYAELITLYQVTHLSVADACALLGQDYSLLLDLDEYAPVDIANCASVGPRAYQLTGFDIIADSEVLSAARWLAWVDVINSADWILVCVVLEIEVRLQLRGNLSDQIMNMTKLVKFGLYSVLFAAAAYWGYAGSFLDFWDAALWLFAFIFIELNVFEWQHETSQELAAEA
ncbi:MAG: hypothetical protein DRR04_14070 [Gammaproteobacteria bacterium]|nr:MAG: hypothetical protein DRQ97_05215 [Gammaproteobacteria bacterium]RLA56416.1 MAG: hypothetical protein DRR04_14070 [Gammaproteobacteria bacterium]